MYSTSHEDKATTRCLRLPDHQAIVEEEQDACGALPRVNVTGEVTVTVAHQPYIPHPPPIAQNVFQHPSDVADRGSSSPLGDVLQLAAQEAGSHTRQHTLGPVECGQDTADSPP
jgi:hypothetical protein